MEPAANAGTAVTEFITTLVPIASRMTAIIKRNQDVLDQSPARQVELLAGPTSRCSMALAMKIMEPLSALAPNNASAELRISPWSLI